MRRKKKRAEVDRGLLLSDLQSPDELARSRALGLLCPCRNDCELFEQHVHIVSQLTKDGCSAIRLGALHILQDAGLIQSIEDAEYRFQSVEDVLRKKHAPFSRGVEVRRSGRFKKRKGSFVLR